MLVDVVKLAVTFDRYARSVEDAHEIDTEPARRVLVEDRELHIFSKESSELTPESIRDLYGAALALPEDSSE